MCLPINMSIGLKSIFVPCLETRRDATQITGICQCVSQAIWSTQDRINYKRTKHFSTDKHWMCYGWLHSEMWILCFSARDWQRPDATMGTGERTVRKTGEESYKIKSQTSNLNSFPTLKEIRTLKIIFTKNERLPLQNFRRKKKRYDKVLWTWKFGAQV